MDSFEDSISRPGEEAHLLTGSHHQGAGLRQPIKSRAGGVLPAERLYQGGAPLIGELDFSGRGSKRVEIAKRMAVEIRCLVRMVGDIRGERSGVRQFCLAEAVTV